MSSTKFHSLNIQGWRQFGNVDIQVHPRLTVLTGANGAGKSSLLRIIHGHFGIQLPFLSTPIHKSNGGYAYWTGIFTDRIATMWQRLWPRDRDVSCVGVIKYDNGIVSRLQVPSESRVQYNITIEPQQSVSGFHIDSHAPLTHFQQVGQIPTTIIDPGAAYSNYNNELVQKYAGGHTGYSPAYRLKESIIAMAMFGEGNAHVMGNAGVLKAYKGFVECLRTMLPESLGFVDISVRPPDVVLVTKSGEFILDASSGGVMTIVDLTWRLHMFAQMNTEFVVTIDEPENHLHPIMQRTLMPRLLQTFPGAQFIVATHSPFMVTSVKDSNVYVLKYASTDVGNDLQGQIEPSESRRVVSEKLDTINKAGTASEVLREVLGVVATTPEWVEEELSAIVERYRSREITREVLSEIREELSRLGYDALYPEALAALTEGQ